MGQPKFITDPSYDALHNAAVTMVREARTHGWIDAVVAPIRGGLLFGVIASHKLNVPLSAIAYSSKRGAGDDKNHSNVLPMAQHGQTILLVDDIVDTGNTLKEIVDHYTSKGVKVITAVFHYKEGAVFAPDLYYWRIPADSEFINYPYELG
jgi:hypoxanthine phosphoribosyltransferase